MLLGCPRADAEDIVQTALLKCYRSWRRVARADHPDAYVHRILVTPRRRPRPVLARRAPDREPARPRRGRRPDGRHRRTAGARGSLARAPRGARPRFYADLSERDTSVALGVAPGTVKSRMSRALAALAPLVEAPDAH